MTELALDDRRRHHEAERLFARKRMFSIGLPVVAAIYLVYVFFAFDVPGLVDRARLDNAQILVADSYSHKTHVTLDTRSGEVEVAIEGEIKGLYPDHLVPDWIVQPAAGEARVDLGSGQVAEIRDGAVWLHLPDGKVIEARPTSQGVETTLPEGLDVPVNVSDTRLTVTLDDARLTVTRTRIEVLRYFFGWEMFWFDLQSAYAGRSATELAALAFGGERIDPERHNITGMLRDFWNNRVWRHGDVAWALVETVIMAFIGTFGAAIIALPLGFLAARNFAPSLLARFGLRRVFDFLRGVDGLIWTIVLSRAFGPGPMTGSLAILLTECGTFGKIFSEALENTDNRQIEGVRATGANAVQRYRFGVIPQVMPVLLSQVLYYFESNTRSATIIGAIVGGGIGLFLTQAIITQKDWEQVAYYIVLIIIMVMLMDSFSGWLRTRLIKGRPGK
ncbi:MAG: phosphonate ABC transporter, permease protein PhnE [Proteobacteria bacterium]|nr:phosphonate ABC transporter, permease protein PhnE [Pseudomonadota bacterium]MDA0952614.1 phosphonate ABC transporter, permease protein PhnE [Pseudomonadota bacterium]